MDINLKAASKVARLVIIAELERQLTETQARLRKANCDYGSGWLSDDLECGVDAEPWCGKHAVLYYIRANKEAQRKLSAVAEFAEDHYKDGICLVCPDDGHEEPHSPAHGCWVLALGRILKEGE